MEVDIIGDLNCNVGATSPDCSTQKLLDICDSYQYRQLIDQPTRITQLTSSIIDLFLTNHPLNFSDSGVTDIGISDHCLVYAIIVHFSILNFIINLILHLFVRSPIAICWEP